jgi:DNA processing protein
MKWQKADLKSQFKMVDGANVDPPIEKLYISGSLPDLTDSIAVVGSRRVSEYGKRVCREFVDVLARAGLTIISGLMYGIDIEAHNAAIEAKGKTIGVLGYGHDYLKQYGYAQNMYERILETKSGAVISEYEPNEPAAKWTFPKRNRIIAALSKAVLVIEGTENSGSLITAGYAIEQGKDVFAVPGSIYNANSKGTNWLIKQGAHMASTPEDLLLFYGKTMPDKINSKDLDQIEHKILSIIESLDQTATSSKIAEISGFSIGGLNTKLSKLELSGHIFRDTFGRFSVLK